MYLTITGFVCIQRLQRLIRYNKLHENISFQQILYVAIIETHIHILIITSLQVFKMGMRF